MIRNFRIVKVDYKYCDYLRQFDNRVPYNAGSKELRHFSCNFILLEEKCNNYD